VSLDATRKLCVRSVNGNKFGLIFIDCTNTPFAYGMKSKDAFHDPKYLKQFLKDFRDLFRGWKVCKLRVLRTDNASEFKSAEVKYIYLEKKLNDIFQSRAKQFQNGKAKKCIGDVWKLTKVALLFSDVPIFLWDEA
jgi:hypothetical protein